MEVLDPATGTGTFICELLEHFRGQREKLAWKYKEELHANEVAILPYYVANLNIEATYAAITGRYVEFPSLCFVDTLDNVTPLGIKRGQHVGDLFGALSEENVERVKRQNRRKISVVIGNPPYNANQQNENDNNKNRAYPHIDDLIRRSYIARSTAQKTKLYDMYARFFRWATDRLPDEGIVAFITNRSFIDSRTFDGFRQIVAEEFADIYIVDLGGDVRSNPKISGTRHNVFGIQTGVAISFFVKRRTKEPARINYVRRPEFETAADKLSFLSKSRLATLAFEKVEPDKKRNWVDISVNDWDALIPLIDKKTKVAKWPSHERAVFRLFSLGLSTSRDDWVYDLNEGNLRAKFDAFSAAYEAEFESTDFDATQLKWTRSLLKSRQTKRPFSLKFSVASTLYRPFVTTNFASDFQLTENPYQMRELFGGDGRRRTPALVFTDPGSQKPFMALALDRLFDLHFVGAAASANALPRFRYINKSDRIDNITNWAENKFQTKYGRSVTKDDIFGYVYAVLHDPIYREKYSINLKREFPRVPFYPDFKKWVGWGEKLLALHVGFETVDPWPIRRTDQRDDKARDANLGPKVFLRADKANSSIRIDSETILSGLPPEAWTYKLGNRSGVEWILDQYKEKTPKDPTVRERFNTYKFADYKEKVIDLIARVARVSVETMAIVEEMKKARRE